MLRLRPGSLTLRTEIKIANYDHIGSTAREGHTESHATRVQC